MTQLTDLNDYCLLTVLDLLSTEQVFKMLGVDKRLNQLASDKLQVKIRAISLNESDTAWSKCVHPDAITNQDQVLVPKSLVFVLYWFTPNLQDESLRKARFLRMLINCSGVKSIDFGYFRELTGDFFLEVFRRCPELECLKVGNLNIKEEDWNRVLNEFGHRIVHFANNWNVDYPTEDRLFTAVAEKCPNIIQVDWLTVGLFASSDLFKILSPKSWITIKCQKDLIINRDWDAVENSVIFEEAVDELDIRQLNWPSRSRRAERLESLKFWTLFVDFFIASVEFVKLKKLDIIDCYQYVAIECLIASHFPQLEEFCFNTGAYFIEDDYDTVFSRMPNVKKLVIWCREEWQVNRTSLLPGSAIHQLKKLETIHLNIITIKNSN